LPERYGVSQFLRNVAAPWQEEELRLGLVGPS
jgi:hypothetical protein